VLFHGAGIKGEKRMLVTEFVERGSLRDYLDDDKVRAAGRGDSRTLLKYAVEMALNHTSRTP
jgi:hypothetical protein